MRKVMLLSVVVFLFLCKTGFCEEEKPSWFGFSGKIFGEADSINNNYFEKDYDYHKRLNINAMFSMKLFEKRFVSFYTTFGTNDYMNQEDNLNLSFEETYFQFINKNCFNIRCGFFRNPIGIYRSELLDRDEMYLVPMAKNFTRDCDKNEKTFYVENCLDKTLGLEFFGKVKNITYKIKGLRDDSDYDANGLITRLGLDLLESKGLDIGVSYFLGDFGKTKDEYYYNRTKNAAYGIDFTYKNNLITLLGEFLKRNVKYDVIRNYEYNYEYKYEYVSDSFNTEIRIHPFENKQTQLMFQYDYWKWIWNAYGDLYKEDFKIERLTAGVKIGIFSNLTLQLLYQKHLSEDLNALGIPMYSDAVRLILTFNF